MRVFWGRGDISGISMHLQIIFDITNTVRIYDVLSNHYLYNITTVDLLLFNQFRISTFTSVISLLQPGINTIFF